MTITRLLEGLPADERLAVSKLCKIRGETVEEFARFALWKASQAVELTAEDYATLATESRRLEASVAARTALITLTPGPNGRTRLEVHGELAEDVFRIAQQKGITPGAALREVMALTDERLARS